MVAIEKLCYVRLGVGDLDRARDFATRIVGLEPVAAPEGTAMFRSDFRDHTLVFLPGDAAGQSLALELRTKEALNDSVRALTEAGYAVTMGDAAACAARRVKAFASFRVRNGVAIELVVRPLHSGWRCFPSRDAGIVEFFGVALASTDVEADIRLWTGIFNGRVTDYVGDAAYVAIDDEHHRIALHPSRSDRLLEVQFRLEGMHEVMRNSYFLQSMQVPVAHGPGRRPTSGQVFLSFEGPDAVLFGFVADGNKVSPSEDRLPRQFPRAAESFCAWGSVSDVPEFSGAAT